MRAPAPACAPVHAWAISIPWRFARQPGRGWRKPGGMFILHRMEPTPAPPQDFAALCAHIAQSRATLPKRLAQIADFALRQPQDIAFHTLAAIATQAQVPPSALVRFAQALGFEGFSGLQAVFRAHARDRWPDYDTRLEALRGDAQAAGPGALLHGFAEAGRTSLERLEGTLDPQALAQAVLLLSQSQGIFLAAARRAFPIAAYLSYALRRLGVRCELADHAGGLAAEQVALLGPRDVVLAVSFTPYAPATVELASAAKRRGVPVVAVTDSPFSPLTESATVWLEVAESAHLGFRSLAGTFALATTLAVAVAQERRRQDGQADIEQNF